MLRDLKALLIEAKQKVPPFLAILDSLNDELMDLGGMNVTLIIEVVYCFLSVDDHGCSYCGGLGHRITDCPKLEAVQQKQAGTIGRKDYLASSAADW